jgi:hypothetical protein
VPVGVDPDFLQDLLLLRDGDPLPEVRELRVVERLLLVVVAVHHVDPVTQFVCLSAQLNSVEHSQAVHLDAQVFEFLCLLTSHTSCPNSGTFDFAAGGSTADGGSVTAAGR